MVLSIQSGTGLHFPLHRHMLLHLQYQNEELSANQGMNSHSLLRADCKPGDCLTHALFTSAYLPDSSFKRKNLSFGPLDFSHSTFSAWVAVSLLGYLSVQLHPVILWAQRSPYHLPLVHFPS